MTSTRPSITDAISRAEAMRILGVTHNEMMKLFWAELVPYTTSPVTGKKIYSKQVVTELAEKWKRDGIPWPFGMTGADLQRRWNATKNPRKVNSIHDRGIKTTGEAAKFLNISVSELQEKTKSGAIPHLMIGVRRCYDIVELRKYKEAQQKGRKTTT